MFLPSNSCSNPPIFHQFCQIEDEKACEMALSCLEEQIVAEGPNTIAAIMVESIPGSAGVLIPAVGFMEGTGKDDVSFS